MLELFSFEAKERKWERVSSLFWFDTTGPMAIFDPIFAPKIEDGRGSSFLGYSQCRAAVDRSGAPCVLVCYG